MPRFARIHAPGVVHHIVARFVNREFFFDISGAREKYLSLVPGALTGSGWRPLSFALMSSHPHWCFEAGSAPAWVVMQRLHTAFARWLNRRLGRIGPVFADRFLDVLVEPPASPIVVAYGHNNPVRAGVAATAADSTWTSHRAYLGLDAARGLELCGFGTGAPDRAAFDAFVAACADRGRDERLTGDAAARVRREVRSVSEAPLEVTESRVTASGGHLSSRSEIVASAFMPLEILSRPSPAVVIAKVAECLDLRPEALRSRARVRALVEARRLALAVWVLAIGGRQRSMADALGLSESAASHLLRVAWARVDPRIGAIAAACCPGAHPAVEAR